VKSLSVAMLNKYEEMVSARFNPLIEKAEAASNVIKANIRAEIRKEWGLDLLEAKQLQLEKELELVKEQICDISGKRPSCSSGGDEHKLEAEVDRRLRERDGLIFTLQEMKAAMVERVWLMTAPAEMTAFIEEISNRLPALETQVKNIKMIE